MISLYVYSATGVSGEIIILADPAVVRQANFTAVVQRGALREQHREALQASGQHRRRRKR